MAKTKTSPAVPVPSLEVEAPRSILGLDDAVLGVMEECPYIQKTGQVGKGGYGYKFASEVDFLAALHPLMVKYRLTVMPVKSRVLSHEPYQTDKGSVMNRIILRNTYRVCHAPTGQTVLIQVTGEAADLGDKATPKAMTLCLKYALRQLFNIETGLDPDNTAAVERVLPSIAPPVTPSVAPHVTPATAPAVAPPTAVAPPVPAAKTEAAPKDENPAEGPLGDSFKRCLQGIKSCKTEEELKRFKTIVPHKVSRTWNYSDTQREYLLGEIAKKDQELKGKL